MGASSKRLGDRHDLASRFICGSRINLREERAGLAHCDLCIDIYHAGRIGDRAVGRLRAGKIEAGRKKQQCDQAAKRDRNSASCETHTFSTSQMHKQHIQGGGNSAITFKHEEQPLSTQKLCVAIRLFIIKDK